MKEILFSIAIPAYKKRYLAEAIDSVLHQSYSYFEIVVVDDCSPEDLGEVVGQFDDPRVHYYRNKTNCGAVNVVENWNICLNYCQGDYVICMGDDDRLLPNCLSEYLILMNKYPNLSVYHALTEIIDDDSKVVDLQQCRPEYETAYSLAWHRWTSRYKQYIGDFCFEVSTLKNDGGFYKLPLAWASDDITAVRAAINSGIANTQVPCFQYRVNVLSISKAKWFTEKYEAVLLEKVWYESFLSNNYCKTELDSLFMSLMKSLLPSFINRKIKKIITLDIESNPFHIFKWLQKKHWNEIDFRTVFFGLLRSLRI